MQNMTTKFVMLSGIRVDHYYNLIKFNQGISIIDIQLGETDSTNIKSQRNLGKLLQIQQYGRPYDPEIILHFQDETVNPFRLFTIDPSFGSIEAYVEYETEEMSKARILERTQLLEEEILGNDWALRPENVVLTQGIVLDGWTEGSN
jgi:hypothetical protein